MATQQPKARQTVRPMIAQLIRSSRVKSWFIEGNAEGDMRDAEGGWIRVGLSKAL